MEKETLYRFVSVKYRYNSRVYDYRCEDEQAKVGSFVNVHVGRYMELKAAKVMKVFYARREDMELPFDVYKTVDSLVPDYKLEEVDAAYHGRSYGHGTSYTTHTPGTGRTCGTPDYMFGKDWKPPVASKLKEKTPEELAYEAKKRRGDAIASTVLLVLFVAFVYFSFFTKAGREARAFSSQINRENPRADLRR